MGSFVSSKHINVETTLTLNFHQRFFNFDIWLKSKFTQRMLLDFVSALAKQHLTRWLPNGFQKQNLLYI